MSDDGWWCLMGLGRKLLESHIRFLSFGIGHCGPISKEREYVIANLRQTSWFSFLLHPGDFRSHSSCICASFQGFPRTGWRCLQNWVGPLWLVANWMVHSCIAEAHQSASRGLNEQPSRCRPLLLVPATFSAVQMFSWHGEVTWSKIRTGDSVPEERTTSGRVSWVGRPWLKTRKWLNNLQHTFLVGGFTCSKKSEQNGMAVWLLFIESDI